jgi:cell division septal protein FtsQ
MKRQNRRYVRQMPKIYGDLHKEPFSWVGILRGLQVALWLGAAICLVYAVAFSGWFTVRTIMVQGTVLTSSSRVKELIPTGTNVLAISTDSVSQRLLTDKRIESIAVLRGLPNSLRVIVKEKEPALLWISGTAANLVDRDGFVFATYSEADFPDPASPAGQLLSKVPKVRDDKALPATLDKQVVSPRFITFLADTQVQLANYLPELKVDHIEVVDTTYDVTFFAKQGMQVQFNTLGDSGVQVRNLTRLIHQQKATFASRVDLRIDRWAYVQ